MIDPIFLREHPQRVKASQRARGADERHVEEALQADQERRNAIAQFEELRAEQKSWNSKISSSAPDSKQGLVAQMKEHAVAVKAAQAKAGEAEERFQKVLARIDNVIIDAVPEGTEEDYVVLKHHGQIPSFDYPVRDHLEIGQMLDAFDIQRGAKVSGSRFVYLKGIGARLEIAFMNMGLQYALQNSFVPLITPTLVRPNIMQGTGFLGEHADEVYYVPSDDLYLTGTSEVALAGYHSDEILEVNRPLRYAGWSTCYRREAGSAGKDTRGIIRVHQFNKLEMFVYCHPDQAAAEHEQLVFWQEEMMQALDLRYRIIDVAAGDLGSSAARKYDIEAWIPSQQTYRELTSTSNCTTFQARRLNTRYRTGSGKTAPVATLNGTLATTRWLVAFLETHQHADGTIHVPEPLRPFLGGCDKIEPECL